MTATEFAREVGGLPFDVATRVGERTWTLLDRRRGSRLRRGWVMRRALLAADILGLLGAFAVIEAAFSTVGGGPDTVHPLIETSLFVATLPVWVVVAKVYGLYDRDVERTDFATTDDFSGVFHLVTVGTWLVYGLVWLTGIARPDLSRLLLFWISAIVLVAVLRTVARALSRRHVSYLQNTLIVGAGEVGQLVARKLLQHPEYGINLIGFADSMPPKPQNGFELPNVLGPISSVPELVELLDVERVIVAFSGGGHQELLDLIRSLKDHHVLIDVVPRLFEQLGPVGSIHTVEGIPLVAVPPSKLPRSSLVVKRGLDVIACTAGLLVLAPLLLLIALAVKLQSSGPVIYRHRRLGRTGRPFELLKFRTMRIEACSGPGYGGAAADQLFRDLLCDPERRRAFETSYKLRDDPRVTRLGSFLRRTSLDELPQLFNVLRGEMSLVGPRPITAGELNRYNGDEELLLRTKPGITGYWQINGRSRLDYGDRIRLDLEYVSAWSLKLDLLILGRTARALLRRQDAY